MLRRRIALLLFACPAVARAQLPADPVKAEQAFAARDLAELDCEISTHKPALDFRFVWVARGTVRVPARSFEGPRHYLNVLLRIHAPASVQPVYLSEHWDLPAVPEENNGMILTEFGFAAGEGQYAVDLLVIDDARRACRRQLNFSVGRASLPGDLPPAMAPGVASRVDRPDFAALPPSRAHTGRLTVLVNAAALRTRQTATVPDEDVLTLSDATASVLRQENPEQARVVVFSVAERRELLRADFRAAFDMGRVTRAIGSVRGGAVDYADLKMAATAPGFLEGLIASEMTADPAPDAVILISPRVRSSDRAPKFPVSARGRAVPLWLLEFLPVAPVLRGPAGVRPPLPFSLGGQQAPGYINPLSPDLVSEVVEKAHGRVDSIASPRDFAAALAQLRKTR